MMTSRECFCWILALVMVVPSVAATTIKTRYVIDDGEGFWSTEPPVTGQRGEGNPGTTLGEQRKYAHEFATELIKRVVWVERRYPLMQYTLIVDDIEFRALAQGASGFAIQKPDDTRPYFYPAGLLCPEHWRCPEGWEDRQPDAGFVRVDDALEGGYRFGVGGNLDVEYSTTLLDLSVPDGEFVGVAMHESIHHLGILSELSRGAGLLFQGHLEKPITFVTKFDQFVQHEGATPRSPGTMTLEQIDAITTEGQDVRFGGPLTMLAAPKLLLRGFDDTASSNTYGEVYLHTLNGVHAQTCDVATPVEHLASEVSHQGAGREIMMSACGATPAYLGIVAYMMADLGWGPVIDSTIAVSTDQAAATIEIAVQEALEDFDKAVADNLLVNIQVPEGVSVASAGNTPADCTLDEVPYTCRYASLDSAATIALTLDGVPGVHAIKVDVDHQAPHVDPQPINNFASAFVTVGENTITSTSLDDNAVPENEAADTKVGAFVVDSTGGPAVSP